MKNLLHLLSKLNRKHKGFTLIELLITILIIAVLAAVIGLISYNHLEQSRKIVCETNLRQIEKHYELNVVMKDGIDKNDVTLNNYLISNGYDSSCPSGGVILVENDTLKCSKHFTDVDQGDEDDDGAVPYLFNSIRLDK